MTRYLTVDRDKLTKSIAKFTMKKLIAIDNLVSIIILLVAEILIGCETKG